MTGDDLLFDACRKGQLKVVNDLIERILVFKLKPKANVNAKDSYGYSPLFYAVRDGHRDIVRTLLAKGAEVNAKDREGATPIFHAVRAGHKEIANLLIAKGADVNAKDRKGLSLLYYAKLAGHDEIVRRLIAKGAEEIGDVDKIVNLSAARALGNREAKSGANVVPANGSAKAKERNGGEVAGGPSSRPTPAKAKLEPARSEAEEEALVAPVDKRLENIGDINDFIYDERDRLLAGGHRRDDSAEVVWDLLGKYKLFRGMVVCDHIEKCRAILMYATGEGGGLPDMVGEIGWVPNGAALIIGGDLRDKSEQWFKLIELVSKRHKELGVIEASFYDMEGETSIIIEKSPQRRLTNLGKALGGRGR